MSNDKLQFLSPLFLKYQSDFEKNPRSRVFAPLAESYRKIGMTDKAMEILSQGIRYNPGYVMGYMGLAFCYFDLKQFNLAYSTLRPLVESNRDNIRLQKLFADTCIAINHNDEALETLKYLLFINPRDKEIAKLVSTLEAEVDEQYKPNYKPIVIPAEEFTSEAEKSNSPSLFDVEKLNSTPKIDFDDWLHIDFANTNQKEKKVPNLDSWNVQKLVPKAEEKVIEPQIETSTIELALEEKKEEAPIDTHTLVDLDELENATEEDGRRNLMSILDEKILSINEPVSNDDSNIKKKEELERKLSLFLKRIHEKALDYQNRF